MMVQAVLILILVVLAMLSSKMEVQAAKLTIGVEKKKYLMMLSLSIIRVAKKLLAQFDLFLLLQEK